MGMIIGIGDLHGHFPALQAILESCQLEYGIFSDRECLVLRPDVKMVFTGDYIDRGHQNIPVIGTVMDLQRQNPGNVHALFGNHEFLALSALYRAGLVEEKIRNDPLWNRQWEDGDWNLMPLAEYVAPWRNMHGRNGGVTFIQEFGPTPAAAFSAYVQRMSREGDIGGWMRRLKPLHVQEVHDRNILFVHGGIPHSLRDPKALETYIDSWNEHMEQQTSEAGGNTAKYLHDTRVGDHSIFWDRSMPRSDAQAAIEAVRSLNVDHIVIGHTPRKGVASYGGAVFDIDVGMTPKYGEGEPACIVFKEKGIFALYARQGEKRLLEWL